MELAKAIAMWVVYKDRPYVNKIEADILRQAQEVITREATHAMEEEFLKQMRNFPYST